MRNLFGMKNSSKYFIKYLNLFGKYGGFDFMSKIFNSSEDFNDNLF